MSQKHVDPSGLSEHDKQLAEEQRSHDEAMSQIVEMLTNNTIEMDRLMDEIAQLEMTNRELRSNVEVVRSSIKEKQSRSKGKTQKQYDNELDAFKAQAAATCRKVLPVFIQSLCKYRRRRLKAEHDEERKKEAGGKHSRLKFWKKDKKSEKSPPPEDDEDAAVESGPNLQFMQLEVPDGAIGPSQNVASGLHLTFNCSLPDDSVTIEDLAERGGSATLQFGLRHDAGQDLEPLINAAKGYFESYFAARVREEGGQPEVNIQISGGRLTCTVRLSVSKQRVGGVLDKVQRLVQGELDAFIQQSGSETDSPTPTPREATGENHPVLGPYSPEEAKEALKLLTHTRLFASFHFDRPFSDIMHDGKVNWSFLDRLTGGGELVLERGVYKAIQKVVHIFSTVASAKMSLGGMFYKRLNFKVEGMLFRAIREDAEILQFVQSKIDTALGQTVDLTPDLMKDLRLLAAKVESFNRVEVTTGHVDFAMQFQGFDFFGIALAAAETKLSRSPPLGPQKQ